MTALRIFIYKSSRHISPIRFDAQPLFQNPYFRLIQLLLRRHPIVVPEHVSDQPLSSQLRREVAKPSFLLSTNGRYFLPVAFFSCSAFCFL